MSIQRYDRRTMDPHKDGLVILYDDYIAERQYLCDLLLKALPYVQLSDHEGRGVDELSQEYPDAAECVDNLRNDIEAACMTPSGGRV